MSLAAVERAIAAAVESTAQSISPVGAPADELLEPLRRVASGGKRLRAQLLLAAHDAHGGASLAAAAEAAAAVELFQTAALIHDDVLDAADLRRGQPTIHRALAAEHDANAWRGDPEHFGTASAILAGDLVLMAAHRALARAGSLLDADHAAVLAELFADMAELCTAGQYLDMRLAAQAVESLAEQEGHIIATMRAKTASYTAEFPLALGATTAGADAAAIAGMRALGVPLGIAFQLRDDVLGLVGSPAVTGKPAGDDIREGKRTLLVAHAWTHGDDRVRALLTENLGNPRATEDGIIATVSAVVEAGAVEAAEALIADYAGQAESALASAASSLARADALDELTRLIAATTARAS